MRIWTMIILLCAAAVLIGRIAGPADMYEKDQPKTLAYTVDMVLHGRWALPRDVLGQPATKPPLYNWLATIIVGPFHLFEEWAMKWPSVGGTIVVSLLCIYAARKLRLDRDDGTQMIGVLAAAIWVANTQVLRLMYLARPDMVQAACLTGAWLAATILLRRADSDSSKQRRELKLAAIFWLCVAGAALAKGPASLLAVAYAIVAARLIGGRWKCILQLHFEIGIPLVTLLVGAWLFFAFQQDAQHVKDVLINRELLHRAIDASPEGISHPFYMMTLWFGAKFLPWSAFALVPIFTPGVWKRGFRHPMAPVMLWLVVLIAGLSLSAGKRIDYLLPTYAPGALMAAWGVVEMCRVAEAKLKFQFCYIVTAMMVLAMSGYLIHYNFRRTLEAKGHYTDNTIRFIQQIKPLIGKEPVAVLVRGKHPIATLLGRHAGDGPTDEDLRTAKWVIVPELESDLMAQAVSKSVPIGFEVLANRPAGNIALYRLGEPNAPTFEQLQILRNQMLTWTTLDNPYRSPRTDRLINPPAPQ